MGDNLIGQLLQANPGNKELQMMMLEYVLQQQQQQQKQQVLGSIFGGGQRNLVGVPMSDILPPQVQAAEDYSQPEEPVQPEQPGGLFGAARNLAKGLIQPAVQGGKWLAEGSKYLGGAAVEGLKGTEGKDLWKYGRDYDPMFYQKEEWDRIANDPMAALGEGVKSGAGIASYIPMAMGAPTTALEAAGMGAGAGAGAAASQSKDLFSEEGLYDVGGGALLGGGAGVAGYGVGKALGALGSKLQNRTSGSSDKAFNKLVKGFKSKPSEFGMSEPEFKSALRSGYDALLETGYQPKTEAEYMAMLRENSMGVKKMLDSTASRSIAKGSSLESLRKAIKPSKTSRLSGDVYENLFQGRNYLAEQADAVLSPNATDMDVLNFKRSLQNIVGDFGQGTGVGGTQKELAEELLDLSRNYLNEESMVRGQLSSLDDILTMSKGKQLQRGAERKTTISVRPLGIGMSANLRPGMDAIAGKTTPNVLGQPSGISQAIGKGLGTASQFGGQAGIGLGLGLAGQSGLETPQQTPTPEPSTGGFDYTEQQPSGAGLGGGMSNDQLIQLYMVDPDMAKFVQGLYGEGEASITPGQKTLMSNMNSSITTIDELERMFDGLDQPESLIEARATALPKKFFGSTLGMDEDLSVYLDIRDSAAARLARAFGEVGNLNEQDIQRMLRAIPTVSDNKRTAEKKFRYLRDRLEEGRQSILTGEPMPIPKPFREEDY